MSYHRRIATAWLPPLPRSDHLLAAANRSRHQTRHPLLLGLLCAALLRLVAGEAHRPRRHALGVGRSNQRSSSQLSSNRYRHADPILESRDFRRRLSRRQRQYSVARKEAGGLLGGANRLTWNIHAPAKNTMPDLRHSSTMTTLVPCATVFCS